MDLIKRMERRLYLDAKRRKLINKTPSILSDNCNGGMILHDMQCRFNSPTVNLYMLPEDYLAFVSDPQRYLSAEPVEIVSDKPFPVGRIGDITVYFMHYDTFEQAKQKWCERATRVDMNNVFLMMTDKNGCTEDHLRRFDALPYPHKVVFTHKPYPEIASAVYMKGFEEAGEVGVLSDPKPGFFKRRYLDDFDYVRFLNGEDGLK